MMSKRCYHFSKPTWLLEKDSSPGFEGVSMVMGRTADFETVMGDILGHLNRKPVRRKKLSLV